VPQRHLLLRQAQRRGEGSRRRHVACVQHVVQVQRQLVAQRGGGARGEELQQRVLGGA
jgi:hypothetical protein